MYFLSIDIMRDLLNKIYFRDLPMNSEKDPPNSLSTSLLISFRVGRHPEAINFSYSLASTVAMTDLL